MKKNIKNWTHLDSAKLYGIQNWGAGYFDVSSKGEVIVRPKGGKDSPSISLVDIVSGLKERGMHMPILLRLRDILDSRIKCIHESFRKTIKDYGYKGQYRGVYPIKVNQQQQVLEEINTFGAHYHHGLEVGSKAELIAAIPFISTSESYLICNGYKDREFVDLGLYAKKMGINCIFVIETPSEVPLIFERADYHAVEPVLGVRIKLTTQAEGKWTDSGGDNSAFGLNIVQILELTDYLKKTNKLKTLQLLHYHIGSQIPNIRDIRMGVVEACRVYTGLVKEGAPMGILDLGGGLAVDYDGSHTNVPSSRNYTLDEYCADVVEVIISTLDEEKVKHPTIVTESGRSTVAYYSVLIFNILDVSQIEAGKLPELPKECHDLIHKLKEITAVLSEKNIQECYNDIIFYRDEILQLFKHGVISLRERALAEQIFWNITVRIAEKLKTAKYIPDEMINLNDTLADIYYGNFSLFQSLPDAWAIDQLFPVMPIHRLLEEPLNKAIISDITCDCDGKIDIFIGRPDPKKTLPVHPLKPKEDYYLGVFLVGAYQETLGDLHNLLGDTNIVSIQINEAGDIEYTKEIEGDSVADVLSYVEYDPKSMIAQLRELSEQAVRKGLISVKERRDIVNAYEAGLRGYTYLEK